MKKQLLTLGLVLAVFFAGMGFIKWMSEPFYRYDIDIVDTIYENDEEYVRTYVRENIGDILPERARSYSVKYDFNGSNAQEIRFDVIYEDGIYEITDTYSLTRDHGLQTRFEKIFNI